MENIFENYMNSQPILIKINTLTEFDANITILIDGKKVDVNLVNYKGHPQGPEVVVYHSQGSSDNNKYGIDVQFNNNGSVHKINRIYKDEVIGGEEDKLATRMDYMHSSNIIKST